MSSVGHAGHTREDDFPEINISRIRVGGDLGGLVFVIAMVTGFLVAVPAARDFFGASLVGGLVIAAGLLWWHRRRHFPRRVLGT